jgi:hypothetical protein
VIAAGSWTFDDEDDALTFFEEKLFEVKQHLQQKPLLQATIKTRIAQLTELKLLEDQLSVSRLERLFPLPDFSSAMAGEQWEMYSAAFFNWKLQIFQTESANDLLELIPRGFVFMKEFYSRLPQFELGEEDPKVGVAENVMHLQAGFQWMKETNIQSFSELGEQLVNRMHENETIKLFAMELKRLSLRLSYL